jgi:predicted phosphodiesterase
MKIALISDIHGNLISLDAVLADIEQCRVDRIICLGDVVTTGPHPHECTKRLRELGIPGITGNHEDYLFKPVDETSRWKDTLAWCRQQLTAEDVDYLQSFQPYIEVPLDEKNTLLCFHGSPKGNLDYIAAFTPDAELDGMLAGHKAAIMAGGHTHVQMLRRRPDTLLINSGSVGLPFYRYLPSPDEVRVVPWAEYAIVSWSNGAANIDFRRVAIDFEAIKQAANTSDNPYNWMSCWFVPGEIY